MKLRALPEVSEDIAQAANWYRRESPDLGTEFIDAVYAYLEDILVTPLTRRLVYKNYRRAFLKRFSYAIYYRVDQSEVIVVLVFHMARNPKTVKRLLRNRERLS